MEGFSLEASTDQSGDQQAGRPYQDPIGQQKTPGRKPQGFPYLLYPISYLLAASATFVRPYRTFPFTFTFTSKPSEFPRVSANPIRRGTTNKNGRGQVIGGQAAPRSGLAVKEGHVHAPLP